jgi:hypothetical protein
MVHINVLQELYDLFPSSEEPEDTLSVHSAPDHQLMLHLLVAAVTGGHSPKTMCLMGSLQGHPLSILVDSGSSHTFLSDKLISVIQGVCPLKPPIQVQVANGVVLSCASYIPQDQWSVQGYYFVTDLKILPLPSHDMILGLDWLQSFSPMHIHWQQQWISIPYKGQTIFLSGIDSDLPVGTILQLTAVQPEPVIVALPDLPPALTQLLQEFEYLFLASY